MQINKRIDDYHDFKGYLLWGIDSVPYDDLIKIVSQPDFPNGICGIKVSRTMMESEPYAEIGLKLIRTLQEDYGVAVFDDAKFDEIPSNIMKMAEYHLKKYHPFMINMMAGALSNLRHPDPKVKLSETELERDFHKLCEEYDTMYCFAELCKAYEAKSCVVTVLTSKTPEAAKYEYNDEIKNVTARYIDLAKSCGINNLVCSPLEIDNLKGYGLTMNTPGIRKEGDSADDQARVDTPYGAIMRAGIIQTDDGGIELPIRLVTNRGVWRSGQPIEMAVENIWQIAVDVERAVADLKKAAEETEKAKSAE